MLLGFALALSTRPPGSPAACLGAVVGSRGETPARSSDCTLAVWRDVVDNLSANGGSSPDDTPEFRSNFDF